MPRAARQIGERSPDEPAVGPQRDILRVRWGRFVDHRDLERGLGASEPDSIDGAAAHPQKEPRLDGAAHRVVVARLLPDLDKDVVEHVLRVASLLERVHAGAEKAGGVPVVERGQGLAVPASDSLYELGIAGL